VPKIELPNSNNLWSLAIVFVALNNIDNLHYKASSEKDACDTFSGKSTFFIPKLIESH
jgi:hypothetical protein